MADDLNLEAELRDGPFEEIDRVADMSARIAGRSARPPIAATNSPW